MGMWHTHQLTSHRCAIVSFYVRRRQTQPLSSGSEAGEGLADPLYLAGSPNIEHSSVEGRALTRLLVLAWAFDAPPPSATDLLSNYHCLTGHCNRAECQKDQQLPLNNKLGAIWMITKVCLLCADASVQPGNRHKRKPNIGGLQKMCDIALLPLLADTNRHLAALGICPGCSWTIC